jgi:O-antigen/teichoic acid export membrane protein
MEKRLDIPADVGQAERVKQTFHLQQIGPSMPSHPEAPSAVERHQARAYLREFVPGMVGYGIAIALAVTFGNTGGELGWRLLWWLAPLLPVALVIRAVFRALGRCDEYQRQLQLEGLSVGFAASMFAALTFGLLGIQVDLLPRSAELWAVFAIGMMSWAIAVALRSTR